MTKDRMRRMELGGVCLLGMLSCHRGSTCTAFSTRSAHYNSYMYSDHGRCSTDNKRRSLALQPERCVLHEERIANRRDRDNYFRKRKCPTSSSASTSPTRGSRPSAIHSATLCTSDHPGNDWRQTKEEKKKQKSPTLAPQEQIILKDYQCPSVKDVLKFAIPAISLWLAQPLLSMIDTSTVGLLAGTAQQAALNPAIAVINYTTKIMCFLFSGTTTMMAAAQERDRRMADDCTKPHAAKTLIGALQLSTLVGLALGASVFLSAHQLLALIIGGGSTTDPTVLSAAMKYVRIRALGMPVAGMLGSAQTACLAQGDAKLPILATFLCATTNLGLDWMLIRSPHAWVGGAAGAAWATVLAQYLAAGWVLNWLLTKRPIIRRSTTNNHRKSTRGFLAGQMKPKDLFKLPSTETRKGFLPFVFPVITTQMGRSSASAAIDHVVSSSLSTASMAANQILTSVYYGLVPVAESLSLAAQNFVPGITERDGNPQEQAFAMTKLLTSFAKAAGLCGLFLAAIMGTLPLYCGVFTSDVAVRRIVTAVVPLIFVTCLKHGLFCATEGVLLGQKDLKFLGAQYGIYTFLIPFILLQLKKAALSGSAWVSLVSVWQVFLGYDLFRTVLMVGRILWLERKRSSREKEGGAVSP